jgi:hypothetical protein
MQDSLSDIIGRVHAGFGHANMTPSTMYER